MYRFVTVFYGLTVMPTEVQKVTDILLAKYKEVFVFIDILIATKGTKSKHIEEVREVLNVMDETASQLKAGKCNMQFRKTSS